MKGGEKNMKRIILSLITIVASLGLASATTVAAWTDTVSATTIEVDTASAEIEINTVESGTPSWGTSKGSPFHAIGLFPSNTATKTGYVFDIRQVGASTGDPAMALSGLLTDVTTIGGAPDQSKLLIRVYKGSDPISAGTEVSAWKTLAEWQVSPIAFNSNLDDAAREKRYGIEVKLDPSALDEWQDIEVNFTKQVSGVTL